MLGPVLQVQEALIIPDIKDKNKSCFNKKHHKHTISLNTV